MKFDILFESGIEALRDGYHREAVTSFAVALERFYESSILILMMDKFRDKSSGHLNEENIKKFEKLWRTPLKLSERQLGAFYSLYFNEFLELPVLFDQAFSKKLNHDIVSNPVNFRNRVIHEGYVPGYNETLQYGEAVFKYIEALYGIYHQLDAGTPNLFPRYSSVFNVDVALEFIKRGESIKSLPVTGYGSFISSNVVHPSHLVPDREKLSLTEYIESRHK